MTWSEGTLVLHSAVLGLELRLEDGVLRFYDPTTGQKLLSHQEAEQARREAEERARAAEARVAELEARLQTLQATSPLTPPPSTDSQS
jgi:hypothetical protein